MYARVSPVRSRGDVSPVTPIQPYARIIPYLEQELPKRKERYPASLDNVDSYVVYNKNKQKTWCISHQGCLIEVYG